MSNKYKHLFGPVFSRRLGKSLGIDLIPFKTCSLNCVYCECGLTTEFTTERREYVPVKEVLAELDNFLTYESDLDFITFSGSGEPTLNSGILEIAKYIKDNYPQFKICLITNSTTLTDQQFFDALLNHGQSCIDLIVPSLDAISEDAFQKIDQPAPGVKVTEILPALQEFSQRFSGKIWLEIFILPGVNDTNAELNLFREALEKIKAEKIQLNCLDRPAPYDWVKPATAEQMQRVQEFFTAKGINCEIVGKVKQSCYKTDASDPESVIVELISRRPGTLEDICGALDCDKETALDLLEKIADKHVLTSEEQTRGTFYRIKK